MEPGCFLGLHSAVCVTMDLYVIVTEKQITGHQSEGAPGKSETLRKAAASLKSSRTLLVQSCVYVTAGKYLLHQHVNNVSLHTLHYLYKHFMYAQ